MARLLTIGAEYNAGATADMDYDSTSGSTITYDTTTVNTGTYSWKFVCAATGPFLTRQYTSTSNTNNGYFRTYINVTSMTTASSISIFLGRSAAAGNVINIRLTRVDASHYTLALWDEQASAQKGSSSSNLNTSQWYRLEMSYIYSSGVMSAYIDGTQFASATGTSTKDVNTLRWGSIDASTMTIFFDDIAVNDNTTGGNQTGLPGVGKILRLKPSAAGDVNTFATQTGGTAGSANNFGRVNEVLPDDATTFNGSNTLNQEDLFNITDSGLNVSDAISVVEVWGRFRNNTADATTAFKFEIEKTGSGTIAQSAAIVPNSTTWQMNAKAVPKTAPIVEYTNPDSVTWTQATIDSAQIGYKLTTGGTNRIDVTSVSMIVEYVPALLASAADTTTTSETKTIVTVNCPNTGDTTNTSETVKLQMVSYVNPADTTTTSETVALSGQDYINKSDTATTSETSVVLIPTYLINIGDTSTTSETVTVFIPTYLINTNDTSTTSETTRVDVRIGVDVEPSNPYYTINGVKVVG